ncbi:hypothetical protein N431DRAFT_440138 [Stipitochalara longipes BDJ]|nr:hypothetical protein N431DRAFT_440138 [Stipitochalara longipes BDJ]
MASPSSPQVFPSAHSPLATKIPADPYILTPEILGHEFVTLYVGSKRKKFKVHKKLLCDRSLFFSKAFNGSFKEAQDGVMYLPEDNADVVCSLVDFLYRGTIPAIPRIQNGHSSQSTILLYLLAEK